MIDTHAHLYLPDFEDEIDDILLRATQNGVQQIWLQATDYQSCIKIKNCPAHFPFKYFGGLHPCDVKEDYMRELQAIQPLVFSKGFDGIGEIGIDLYWDKSHFAEQCKAFEIQLHWAIDTNKPAAIHVRDAYPEVLERLQPFKNKGLRGIIHSYSGTLEQAQELIDFGFLLGINGVVTFKKSHLPEILKQLPLQKIVLETDAPYLTPTPHRGKRNEPAYLPLIATKLSEIYDCTPAFIEEQTDINAKSLLL